MEPASAEEGTAYFRKQLYQTGEIMPGWPTNVRSIAPDGLMFLGIDQNNQLYWDGKPIELRRRLKFSRLQIISALLVGLATSIGGVGTGINEGFDFGCKVHVWARGCKP